MLVQKCRDTHGDIAIFAGTQIVNGRSPGSAQMEVR